MPIQKAPMRVPKNRRCLARKNLGESTPVVASSWRRDADCRHCRDARDPPSTLNPAPVPERSTDTRDELTLLEGLPSKTCSLYFGLGALNLNLVIGTWFFVTSSLLFDLSSLEPFKVDREHSRRFRETKNKDPRPKTVLPFRIRRPFRRRVS